MFYACTRERVVYTLPLPHSTPLKRTCVRVRVTFVSLHPSYGRGSETVLLPFPSATERIPSAIRGVTASFGWVRAKETDENRAGMCETRSKGERREGGRGEGSLSNLYRGLCTL